MNEAFLQSTLKGLRSEPKRLSSKFFYDDRGSRLFKEIMGLEEYYLTRKETESLTLNAKSLANSICERAKALGKSRVEVVELGAGDGSKTILLLEALLTTSSNVIYSPVDISAEAIKMLEVNVEKALPQLNFTGRVAAFESLFETNDLRSDTMRVVVFLGSNIGNFSKSEAESFIAKCANFSCGGMLLLGVDLKKNPNVVYNAYNDSQGVTAKFNLNLLLRINKELGGDFRPEQFVFYPSYDPISGEVRSFLVSKVDQSVTVAGHQFSLAKNEPIHTEISAKYSMPEIEALFSKSSPIDVQFYTDADQWFTNVLVAFE